ncbi:MAG: Hsp20/alpha crystallin family protein [Bacteroidota bacterium]
MLHRSHSIRERLSSRLLSGEELLSRGGNLSNVRKPNISYPKSPKGEIYYDLQIAVPGYKREDLEIMLIDDLLIVKGEKVFDAKEEITDYIRREHEVAAFEKVLELEDYTDKDRIKAKFTSETLCIRFYPLPENGKPSDTISREVEIK